MRPDGHRCNCIGDLVRDAGLPGHLDIKPMCLGALFDFPNELAGPLGIRTSIAVQKVHGIAVIGYQSDLRVVLGDFFKGEQKGVQLGGHNILLLYPFPNSQLGAAIVPQKHGSDTGYLLLFR